MVSFCNERQKLRSDYPTLPILSDHFNNGMKGRRKKTENPDEAEEKRKHLEGEWE
jgi:hypothetical protein